ncbi:hypothetical protein L218DRAFT_979746, partial [Marasmius fiardii PR-910]
MILFPLHGSTKLRFASTPFLDELLMTDTITKRLHISGLTPALTPSDLSTRLSTFGTVKSLDGFGLLDAVGQPRKFAYATLEATPAALKRCFTSLSGTTWKGAKLRIGEAKPDYRARLAEERAKANEEAPRKRQRTHYSKYNATLSSNMSLVTRENAPNRPGWKVMPSGRIVRSMRMRPGKPLPPSDDLLKKPRASAAPANSRAKKRVKLPDSRARIRTIDVTKWNGEYLRGSLLDGQIAVSSFMLGKEKDTDIDHSEGEDEDKNMEVEGVSRIESLHQAVGPDLTLTTASKIPQSQRQISVSPSSQTVDPATATTTMDFVRERAQNMSLLNALLGGTEWDGRESDSEIDESCVIEVKGYTGEEDYEVVPVDREQDILMEPGVLASHSPEKERNTVCVASAQSIAIPAPAATKPNVSLKDLFAPREEDTGFSLLNHLDLELDDDDGLDMAPFVIPSHDVNSEGGASDGRLQPVDVTPIVSISTQQKPKQRTVVNLDPKMPLFFPLPETFSATAGLTKTKGHSFSLSSSSSPFYQSQTEEQIRQRWEENKLELTRGWKKRWREAVKVKRRRGGGTDDVDS